MGELKLGLVISDDTSGMRTRGKSQLIRVRPDVNNKVIAGILSGTPATTTLNLLGIDRYLNSFHASVFDKLKADPVVYTLFYLSEASILSRSPVFVPELPLNYTVSQIMAEARRSWNDRAFGEAILIKGNYHDRSTEA